MKDISKRRLQTMTVNKLFVRRAKICFIICLGLFLTILISGCTSSPANSEPASSQNNSSLSEDNQNTSKQALDVRKNRIAAGYSHSAAVKDDGSVWTWGNNWKGQLGDGTDGTNRGKLAPVKVTGLSDVVSVAAGSYFTAAIKQDGTVWTWGNNDNGQLGDGTTTNRNTPVQVSGISDIVALSAGQNHIAALKADGTVWAWGNNSSGQLGDGTENYETTTPVQVKGLTDIIGIAAGSLNTLAVGKDGNVWGWGENLVGEIGGGELTSSLVPIKISGLQDVSIIKQTSDHIIALLENGNVYTIRANGYGKIVEVSDSDGKMKVTPLKDVVDVAAGEYEAVAVKNDGTVYKWHISNYFPFGNSEGYYLGVILEHVYELEDIVEVAKGNNHTLLLKKDGTVWVWGSNDQGQLGIDSFVDFRGPMQSLMNLEI